MIDILRDGVRKGKIAHFYLFYGETRRHREQALALAAALNCLARYQGKGYTQQGEGDPLRGGEICRLEDRPNQLFCGQCVSCRKVFDGCHPDVEIIGPAKSSIGIDQVMTLQKKVVRKPFEGAYKVYIIEEAEKMTAPAANALLVTAEDPPEYAVLVLSCTSDATILPTLRSRARAVYFPPGDRVTEEADWADALNLSGGNAGLSQEVLRIGPARIRELMGLYEKAVESRDFLKIFPLFPLERDVAFIWLQVMAAKVVACLKEDNTLCRNVRQDRDDEERLAREEDNSIQKRAKGVQLEQESWWRSAGSVQILPWIEHGLRALQRQADVRLTVEVLALKHMEY